MRELNFNGNGFNPNSCSTKILYRKIKTPRAIFFVTDEDLSATYGFWCPKSAIINIGEDSVEHYNWFTPEIQELK